MKRLIFASCFAVCCILVHAQLLPLVNPGFEGGIQGWGCHEWSKGKIAGTDFFADAENPHSGKSSLCIRWREGGDNLLVSPARRLNVKGGGLYVISFWSRAAEAARVQLTVDFYDASGKRIGNPIQALFDNGVEWQKWEQEVQAPENAASMLFYLRCRRIATHFDDVEVKEAAVEGNASVNLLKNPGFEQGFRNWGKFEWSGKPYKINFIEDKVRPRNGEKCAKIEWVSGGDNILIGQNVRVGENKNFMLSFWARADVEVSHNSQVQATARFLDANGKDIVQPQHKIFSASNVYEEFRWSFTVPDNCKTLGIFLRCRKVATYFDDVTLIESKGVYLRSCFVWLPENQLVLNMFNALPSRQPVKLKVEIFDVSQNKVMEDVVDVAYGTDEVVSMPLVKLQPAEYKVKVYPVGQENDAIVDRFSYPDTNVRWPAPYDKLKVRNNFVTELAISNRAVALKAGQTLEFPNPRRGWVFFAFTPEADGEVLLPGKRQVKLKLNKGVPVESMQLLEEGQNQVKALTDVKLANYTITTMAEVFVDEYESDAARRKFTNGLMESYAMKEFMRNANVMQERFDKHNVMDLDQVPESERERIANWRASGRYTITTVTRTGYTSRWRVKPELTTEFWLSRVGLRELDGLGIDEFGSEISSEAPFFAPAVREINKKCPDKMLVAYTCAAWYSHTQTNELRAALAEGHHPYAPEQYLREQPNEGIAKNYINDFFDYARLWEKAFPGAIKNTLWCYGSCDNYHASYCLDTFASCDQKYFLDMQFAVLANDPAFFGQRGVIPWIIRYTSPDSLLWQAKMIRHYLIEGKRTMLSKDYGFQFDAGHLVDGDCAEGLTHWNTQPAEQGSIITREIKDYGFSRGTRNTSPAGDRVIEFRRVPGKVNSVTQTMRNLKPGKYYEVTVLCADGEDVDNDGSGLKVMNLRMTVKGVEIVDGKSVIHVYPGVPNNTRGRKNGIVGNHHRVVFKAKSPTAELVISDEAPVIPARTYHGQPFAPADPAQKRVIFNFVQVTELLNETVEK